MSTLNKLHNIQLGRTLLTTHISVVFGSVHFTFQAKPKLKKNTKFLFSFAIMALTAGKEITRTTIFFNAFI